MYARVIVSLLMLRMFTVVSVEATEPRSDPASVRDANLPHRSLSAIQFDVHNALCAEASARRLGPNAPEVIRLIDLYREMAVHPQRDDSVSLTQLGLKLRLRLEKVRNQIERQNSRPNRDATKTRRLPAFVVPEAHVLAQQAAIPGGAALGQAAQPATSQPGAARTIDYGPDLVELIQQTISPATWDINGGGGSAVYFAPLRVIVVSAPGNVHDQIVDVLGQLRAAP